jgi:hypothetical protein
MEIKITNFKLHDVKIGHVASFDANLDVGVSIRGLSICRPERHPDIAWLVFPSMEREKRQAIGMRPSLR